MSRALIKLRKSSVTKFKPEETKKRQAQAQAVIAYAKKIKDWELLGDAVDEQIDDQIEFVRWWQGHVTPGHGAGRGNKKVTERRPFYTVEEAEKLTEISKQKVSKWALRLKDRAAYRELLHGTAYRTAMGGGGMMSNAGSTGDFERYTPSKYIEAVREVLGQIDLDPASCPQAQKTVRAKKFFTKKTDGLNQQWHGKTFLNPPYETKLCTAFIDKLIEEIKVGRVTEAIVLLTVVISTAFRTAASECKAICFTVQSVPFVKPDGAKAPLIQRRAFFYFGDDVRGFEKVFRRIGFGVTPAWNFEAAGNEVMAEAAE
jgi:DNA N-6-adenine-methyltransferase (Dam)